MIALPDQEPGNPLPSDTSTGKAFESACPRAASEPDTPPSLIETMRVQAGGLVPLLEGHIERMQRSSRALGYRCPDEAALRTQILQTVARLDPSQTWRLRLLLAPEGGLHLETNPLPAPLTPLKVAVQGPRVSGATRWLGHKTTHRPWYKDATTWLAAHSDIFDILYWNENGEMCEGSRSNLYMQTPDGRWLTPPLESGALPGVQRQALLHAGLVQVATIHRDDFMHASAWRISNALRGWCDAKLA